MANRDSQLSLVEAFFSSLMIGAGEVFFGAFALSKGMGELLAGLVIGLPMMMGAVLQTSTPFLFERWGRPKSWVLAATLAQIAALLGLVWTCCSDQAGTATVFLLIGLYWAFSFAGASVLNYWMGFLIPEEGLSAYFARRTRIMQYGIVSGLLLSGELLHQIGHQNWGAREFALPFLIAALARAVAFCLFAALSSAPALRHEFREAWVEVLGFFRSMREVFLKNPRARQDLTFLFLFNTAIYVTSSFVAPFWLAKLHFDPASFMAAQMALYFGRVVSLFRAQGWIDRFGLRKVLVWGAFGISPLPAFWYFVHSTTGAIGLQLLSGFFWGLFDVSVGLLLFSELPQQDKIQLLTWNNFFQTLAVLIGTLIGAKILALMDASAPGYFALFAIGSVARMVLLLHQRRKLLRVAVRPAG